MEDAGGVRRHVASICAIPLIQNLTFWKTVFWPQKPIRPLSGPYPAPSAPIRPLSGPIGPYPAPSAPIRPLSFEIILYTGWPLTVRDNLIPHLRHVDIPPPYWPPIRSWDISDMYPWLGSLQLDTYPDLWYVSDMPWPESWPMRGEDVAFADSAATRKDSTSVGGPPWLKLFWPKVALRSLFFSHSSQTLSLLATMPMPPAGPWPRLWAWGKPQG
jgi:hypothetical protein